VTVLVLLFFVLTYKPQVNNVKISFLFDYTILFDVVL
jgi:hypothetical protein